MFWIDILRHYVDKNGIIVYPGEYLVSGYDEENYEVFTKASFQYIYVPKEICKRIDTKGFSQK